MKLVAAPDSTIDKYDRALWMVPPFDLWWDYDNRLCATVSDAGIVTIVVSDAGVVTITASDAGIATVTVSDAGACNAN